MRQFLETILITIARVEQEQAIEVAALLEALLCQSELSSAQSDVADLSPLFGRLLLLGDAFGDLNVVKRDGQLELMVQVGSKFERQFFLVIELEEFGELAVE